MRKWFMLFTFSLLSLSCLSQKYRGMFEIGGGPVFANEKIHTSKGDFSNKQTTIGGIFATAHGCQFTPWLFAGAGVGVNCEWKTSHNIGDDASALNVTAKNHLISVPLFLDIRWDLDLTRKVSPYADLRLGYQLGMDGYVNFRATSATNSLSTTTGMMKSADGMFVQASAGVRFKIGNNTGVNIGISYIPLMKREILLEAPVYSNRNFLLLNAGFDIQGTGKSTQKEDRKQRLYRLQQQKLKQQSKKIVFE
ncbi:MAG: outer membrane beta-barrel protein [Muribaculaceae bacterium]|nr:outer membrane beta-barrel protein [Muribaculaceae bacterium]